MTSKLDIAIVMDPISQIKPYKDTTLALMLAAQSSGHRLIYIEMENLFLDQGVAKALGQHITVYDDNNTWYKLDNEQEFELGNINALLMRKDPPFDSQFIYATYILEHALKQGCLVVNHPRSLRDCNEKVFATQFPQCCPPVLVSRNRMLLKAFHEKHKDVIFKPLDGMGGSKIFRAKNDDPNVSVIIETLTCYESEYIMAQKFIPEITQGDKRVLVVNGEAIPYSLARIPADGETRGNIAAGGRGVPQPLTDRDKWIVEQVAPTLIEKGLLFVGLDIIGDYLTEINVTSPTCAREIDKAYNTKIGDKLIHAIEQQLQGTH